MLVINALVGFVTEWQAGRALDALRRQTRTTTRVRREGLEQNVDAEALVPGDIVILNAGDRVPADARLLECYRLQTEESALTGESTPLEKAIESVPEDTPLPERYSMLYLGTSIVAGRAVAVVVSTGAKTELGQVGRLVATSVKERSPLEIQLTQLGQRLVYIVLAIAKELRAAYERGKAHAIAVVAEGSRYNAQALSAYFGEHKKRFGI